MTNPTPDPFPWETDDSTTATPPTLSDPPTETVEVDVTTFADDTPQAVTVTPADADTLTPRIVRDLLLLVGYDLDLHLIVEGWDEATLAEVAAYAAAVHLNASDNDVEIPPLPTVLAGRPVWGKVDPSDPVAPADESVPIVDEPPADPGRDGVPPREADPVPCPGCGVANPDRDGHKLACPNAPGFRGGKVPPPHDRIELSGAVLDLRAVDQLLDDLAEPLHLTRQTASMRDTVLDVVRTRATARRKARTETGETDKVTETDLRREAVGAADDADVLAGIASVFKAGADEAKQIAGELLDDLPKRGGKPRASMRVGDGHGFELAIVRSKRSELSVVHDEVDDVLTAALVAAAAGSDVLALGVMPEKTYAAGIRDGVAALRGLLASNPTYRSTALDSLLKQLQNLADDSLAARLTKAYGKVEKGEPTVKLERKPLATDDTKGDDQ